jgi:hypothetical protein
VNAQKYENPAIDNDQTPHAQASNDVSPANRRRIIDRCNDRRAEAESR